MPRRAYPVYRDLEGFGSTELVDRFADELTDAEIMALAPADQAEVLAEIGCIIEADRHGVLCVVTDPALDAPVAVPAVSEAA
ncbi:hypothetical protein [Sorangium sp. So ce233]|uniref:hypothetical protein n=1 Tax=Sorangium sp. So ce233 TaxID=3133290 RepID=UPI003F611A55